MALVCPSICFSLVHSSVGVKACRLNKRALVDLLIGYLCLTKRTLELMNAISKGHPVF